MKKHRLIILAQQGASTNILYHALKNDYDVEAIILEPAVSKKEFLRKRIKKLGIQKVCGQILFQLFIVPVLKFFSVKRKKEILENYNLEDSSLPSQKVKRLKSINSSECTSLISKIKPEVIIVNGTRIISQEVLNSTPVKFFNIHAGITPKYRNVHGAYWALVNNDAANCGVTVHLVDAGIDTGKIIKQKQITMTSKDNFSTYPYVQLAEGIIILKKALQDFFDNRLTFTQNNLTSKLWYHPTLWQYVYNRMVRKTK